MLNFQKVINLNCVKNYRLNKKLLFLKKHNKKCNGSIERICDLAKKYLTENQIKFFESQLRMNKRAKHGKRWTVHDKLVSLRILYHSPQAFCILRQFFTLPSKTTLLFFLSKAFGNLQPGFSAKVFALLKMRVNYVNVNERNCCLVFDAMSLKQHIDYERNLDHIIGIDEDGKPLNHVFVVMVQGIAIKWK